MNYIKFFRNLVSALIFLGLLYLILLYRFYYLLNTHESIWLTIYATCASIFLLTRLLVAFFYEDHHTHELDVQYPSVSFVISCKNEQDSIFQTIAACLYSEYPAKLDCIAIDDGSTDQTWNAMKRAKKKFGT